MTYDATRPSPLTESPDLALWNRRPRIRVGRLGLRVRTPRRGIRGPNPRHRAPQSAVPGAVFVSEDSSFVSESWILGHEHRGRAPNHFAGNRWPDGVVCGRMQFHNVFPILMLVTAGCATTAPVRAPTILPLRSLRLYEAASATSSARAPSEARRSRLSPFRPAISTTRSSRWSFSIAEPAGWSPACPTEAA
jgi:hypothetical protein